MRAVQKRTQNLLIFSEDKNSPRLEAVCQRLTTLGNTCTVKEDLPSYDNSGKADLSVLQRHLPTFDFCIFMMLKNEAAKQKNDGSPIFEMGAAAMALGASRVILLDEDGQTSEMLLRQAERFGIRIIAAKDAVREETLGLISEHIEENAASFTPMIIGAAGSTADGYFSNFIMRFWMNIENGFTDSRTGEKISPEMEKIDMRIIIPAKIDNSIRSRMTRFSDSYGLKSGTVTDPNSSNVNFRYAMSDGRMTVYDMPNAIIASYNTAKDLLHFDVTNDFGIEAEERYLLREIDFFGFTLEMLLEPGNVYKKLALYHISEEKKQRILDAISRVKVTVHGIDTF